MKRTQYLIVTLSFFLISISLGAQNLASLKKSSEYNTGSFPNGINYYLVSNKAVKGYADIALIQKQVPDGSEPGESLCELSHFQKHKPYQVLAENGISCTQKGYVTRVGDATVYRFNDVPTYNTESCDTTLLLLFDIIEKNPYQQTLVICGDIDVANIKGKLSIFSMTVPSRQKVSVKDSYVWSPQSGIDVKVKKYPTENMALLRYTYTSGRIPKSTMGTVLPLISRVYANQAGDIIKSRLQNVFREKNIPVGSIQTEYVGSEDTSGDVTFSVTIPVDKGNTLAAAEISSMELSVLANQGVKEPEFVQTNTVFFKDLNRSMSEMTLDNSFYVDRCVAAELYGASLGSQADGRDFFVKKDVSTDMKVLAFNAYLSALLNPYLNNFSIECLTPDNLLSSSELRNIFESSWNEGKSNKVSYEFKSCAGDTLSLASELPKKIKVKSEATEPMTGGKLLTFANGIRVIYKNVPSNGFFTYSFLLKDGCAAIPDLTHGEGAFVGDVLNCYDVAGMKWYDFRNMLKANCIQMDTHLSVSDLRISGAAPKQKLPLLLKSMVSLANESNLDSESYRYFRNCKLIDAEFENLSDNGVKALADSTLRPDYPYAEYKYLKYYTPSISEKADKFFKKEFSKVNDGIIVLIGDLNEKELQTLLGTYLGAFSTGAARSVRPKYQYFQRSGSATKIVSSSETTAEKGVYLTLSMMSSLTMEKSLTFEMAKMALKKGLVSRLSESGVSVEVDGWTESSPQERFVVFIKILPCRAEGLPSCVTPSSSVQLLTEVKNALGSTCLKEVAKKDVDGLKGVLTGESAFNVTLPSYLCNAVQLRYSDGRDFTSKAADKIKALNEGDVSNMLKELYVGGRVEYVVY